jgi:hypothetical protein
MQLMTSEYAQTPSLFDESARIAFIFDDYKQSVELNKKALALRQTAGISGIQLVPNLSNLGLAQFEI